MSLPCRSSYAEAAVMVAPAYHAGLVRHAEAVGAVVAPEGLRADGRTGRIRPIAGSRWQRTPTRGGSSSRVRRQASRPYRSCTAARAQREAAAVALCIRTQGEAHAGKRQDQRLSHRHSSSSICVERIGRQHVLIVDVQADVTAADLLSPSFRLSASCRWGRSFS